MRRLFAARAVDLPRGLAFCCVVDRHGAASSLQGKITPEQLVEVGLTVGEAIELADGRDNFMVRQASDYQY